MDQEIKSLLAELKSGIGSFDGRFEALQRRIDEIEVKGAAPGHGGTGKTAPSSGRGIVELLQKNAEDLFKGGRLRLETPSLLSGQKAYITSSGIVAPVREAGVHGEGRFPYMLRNLFRSRPITTGAAMAIRSTSEDIEAGSQATEGAGKNESEFAFGGATIAVRTIAHYVNVSRQALDDVEGLAAFLDESLIWGLEAKVEDQLLNSDDTGGELDGLIDSATGFNVSILPSVGWNTIDVLGAAATQLRETGFMPTFYVVHPRDAFRMGILKDQEDRYLMDPRVAEDAGLWGMTPVISDKMLQGSFLVGDQTKAIIRQRMTATLDVSDSHGTNFTTNLLTVRAEERLALVKLREDAFVYGSLNSSPA